MFIFIFIFSVLLLVLVSYWKIFEKAGRKGWEGIIPIYNNWVMAEIVGKPGWVGLLVLIPYLGFVVALYLIYLLSKSFGKGVLFALGMVFLPFIFFPILAFGDDKYLGPPEDDVLKNIEEKN